MTTRRGVAAGLVMLGLSLRPCVAAGQAQAMPAWTLSQATSPTNGEAVVTAQVSIQAAANPTHVYQVTIRCSPSTNFRSGPPNAFRVGLEAFEETAGGPVSRPIPWPAERAGAPRTLPISYQADDGDVHPADLGYAADNRGAFRDLVFLRVPASRLIARGIFPGEDIVVPFDGLAPSDRATLASACIPAGLETVLSLPPGVTQPQPIKTVQPVYPPSARESKQQGFVTLDIRIGPDGRVVSAKVLRGLSPDLEAAAVAAVRQWQYTPTVFDGVPITVVATVLLNFTLRAP